MCCFTGFLKFASTVVLGGILFAGPALAEEPWERELRATFDQADVNKDGVINVDELVGYSVTLFAVLDKNRDGYVYPQDFPDLNAADFAMDDRDKDGRLSLGEAVAGKIIEGFEADTNRDGVLSLEEVMSAERKFRTKTKRGTTS